MQEVPLEVIEHVFHRGCAISTQFCLSLCLVSSWARRLALPYLYSSVKLEAQSAVSTFCKVIAKCTDDTPAIPLARLYVRSLWIEPISNLVIDIVEACENLEYLSVHEQNLSRLMRAPLGQQATAVRALFQDSTTPSTLEKNRKNLHLWVAKGRTHRFHPLDSLTTSVPSPFLSKFTHLRLDCSTGYKILNLNIKRFTRLAYLAVTYDGSPSQDLEELVKALRVAPRRDINCVLILLVDVLTTEQRVETLSWVAKQDVSRRIQVLPGRSGSLSVEWEEELRTGVTVWERTEQRSREIFGEGLTMALALEIGADFVFVSLGDRRRG